MGDVAKLLEAIHATLVERGECMTRDIAAEHALGIVAASNALKMLTTRGLVDHRTVPTKLASGKTERRRLYRAIKPLPVYAVELAPPITDCERHVVEHATGWLSESPLYRNRFIAAEGHRDWSTLTALRDRGVMREVNLAGGSSVFVVTIDGIRALRALPGQPKRTKAAAKNLDALIASNMTETP